MNKRGSELMPGDTISAWFNGGSAQIKSVRPYVGSLLHTLGAGSQIATFYGCVAEMTLPHNSWYEVQA